MIFLDADMKLVLPCLKPNAAARPKWFRFLHFRKPEQFPVEAPRFRLASGWGSQLHVIDADELIAHSSSPPSWIAPKMKYQPPSSTIHTSTCSVKAK
jgi:hypothetical protein